MNLKEFIEKSKEDHNLFWRLQSGEHQNLLDEAIERINEFDNPKMEMPSMEELKNRAIVKLETLEEIKWQIEELHLPPLQVINDWIKNIKESIENLAI